MTQINFLSLPKCNRLGKGLLVKTIGLNSYVYYQYCGMGDNFILKYRMSIADMLTTDTKMLKWDYYSLETSKFYQDLFLKDCRLLIASKVPFDTLPYPETKLTDAEKAEAFRLVDYSPMSIAIFGNTREIKNQLLKLSAKFNKYLTDPDTKTKKAGWVLSITKKDKVMEIINNFQLTT